jgi:flagellar biosynthetic protein FliP
MSAALARRARIVILVLFSLLLAGVVVLSADTGARAEARQASSSAQASSSVQASTSQASASQASTSQASASQASASQASASARPAASAPASAPAAAPIRPAATGAPDEPVEPTPPPEDPGISIDINGIDGSPSSSILVMLGMTLLSVAPALLLMVSSFTKIFVVLAMTRNALSLPTIPPNQVLAGLALFLSLFIMWPVLGEINTQAVQPYIDGSITFTQAFDLAQPPLRDWMIGFTREEDLALMTRIADQPNPADPQSVPLYTLIPAFMISELRSAFIIGFVIFVPFLVIDIVVAAALMSMGMMMLPPVMISLPFKILLVILVDGWGLIIKTLIESYGGVG